MDSLIEKYQKRISLTSMDFVRSIMQDIRWEARLIGIRGARGVGKTTLILQYIKQNLPINESLYVSLDSLWFSQNRLIDLVDLFAKRGGKYLFLDEVHKYDGWSQELKNAYDDYPELKIVFTGSSLLEILNARADLSRRAVVYEMQGLSFREYLNLIQKTTIPVYSFADILSNHQAISAEVIKQVRPLQHFAAYLKSGYYPFFNEVPDLYYSRIEEVINFIIEVELPLLRAVQPAYIIKIKQLLAIIAESAPFVPNVSKLGERIGINRSTFVLYLNYLQETHLITQLFKDATGITRLQKPDKIFLENTNLMYALAAEYANIGNARETFFLNQLNYKHKVEFSEKADFLVDKKFTFEIGGKNKTTQQISGLESAFVVQDDIEFGTARKIPLWQFGLLY